MRRNAKEGVYLRWTVNMCCDMDVEISLRSEWKPFNTLKDVLKAELHKDLRINLFNSTIFPVMLYISEIWATTKKEEQKLVYDSEGYRKTHAENIVVS